MNSNIEKTNQTINNQKQQAADILSGKVEKKKLLIEDQTENDKRLKMLRKSYHNALMDKHAMKEQKIGEMKRIWLNHNKEPVESLYGSLAL